MAPDRRRRRLVAAGAAGAVALGTGAGLLGWKLRRDASSVPAADTDATARPAARPPSPYALAPLAIVDAATALTITARTLEPGSFPDQGASMLAYEVEQGGQRYFNPVLRVRRGSVVNARFWNRLEETSIIHWHGLRVDANNDGNPHYAVGPGEVYRYRIPIHNRAGTCWYHPHPHALTAGQVYRGLASFLIVENDEDDALVRALDLKLGTTDIPLLLQDRRLDAQGRLVRTLDTRAQFLGHLGAEAAVNGRARARLDVTRRIYRLRLLNAASARILRLAFMRPDRPQRFLIIGADGGLLERALPAEEAFLSPGERLDVLLDLRTLPRDTPLVLRSLAFDAMRAPLAALCSTAPRPVVAAYSPHTPHAVTRDSGAEAAQPLPEPLPDGTAFDLLAFDVYDGPRYERNLPSRLARVPDIATQGRLRRFELDHADMQWRINGVRFDMRKTQLAVERGSVEIWELRNPPGGMPHPVHFHGFPFRLLGRDSSPEQVRRLAVDARGLAAGETGWKDTVLVWPSERVRLAIDFSHDYPGEQVYMLHCHNLEHEDQGMMLNVRIVPPGSGRA